MQCGAVAEWSKALAWKVSIRQKRIQGSNPCRSAIYPFLVASGLNIVEQLSFFRDDSLASVIE